MLRDVDIRHLEALVAVVDEGSFARAAQRLGFTQSAVSQQIAALEKTVGLPVLDRPRGPKRAELTPAGDLLLGYARQTLVRADEMSDELDRLRRGVTGRLVIGTFQSVSAQILPGVIGRMRREVPDVDLVLHESDDQGDLLRRLADDELDLTFTVDAVDDDDHVSEFLGHDPFMVVTPAGEISGPHLPSAQLSDRPLIGQPATSVCQVLIEGKLAEAGVDQDYVFRSQDNGAVQGMVRSGLGWAVMPLLAIDSDDPATDAWPLDPPISRSVQLTRRVGRSLPPAADQLAAIAHEVAADVLASELPET